MLSRRWGLAQDTMPKKSEKEKNKDLVKFDNSKYKELAKVGMKGVDPADIRPPKILLMQKMSDREAFADKEGNQPKVGQYFHTGTQTIYDEFECYFIMATKGTWIDRRASEKEGREIEKDQYVTIGVLADDMRPFGMTFRSSSLYTLSSLFTAAASNQRPMFSFKIKMETKELSNDQGKWLIPVARIVGQEEDEEKLNKLMDYAMRFDQKSNEYKKDDEENTQQNEGEASDDDEGEDVPF